MKRHNAHTYGSRTRRHHTPVEFVLSDIILEFIVLLLSGNLPYKELRYSLDTPRFAALGFIVSLSSHHFHRVEIVYVAIPDFGVSNAVWIHASFRL